MKRPNLYMDTNGEQVKGRYIYAAKQGKYQAMCKYPEGYSKTKICYSLEEALDFVQNQYIVYAPGWYYNSEMDKVFLTRPRDPKPERYY